MLTIEAIAERAHGQVEEIDDATLRDRAHALVTMALDLRVGAANGVGFAGQPLDERDIHANRVAANIILNTLRLVNL